MPYKPTICLDARMLEASGIGMIIKNIVPHIIERYQWHLLVNQDSFAVNQWAHHLPHTVVDTPIYSLKEQLILASKFPKADLTWFPHYNVPLTLSKRQRYVVNINDCFHRAFYDTLTLPQKAYATWVMGAAAKRAERIITISAYSEQQIRQYTQAPASKIDTILLAADQAHFSQLYTDQQRAAIKQTYNLPDRYLLFVGNLKPHKNLGRLLQAFAALKANGETDGTKLVLCGNFKGFITGMDNLDVLIESLGLSEDVVRPGFVDNQDLPAIYQMATGFTFPSYYEGFGLPLLEAMAARIPVASSHAASLPEVGGDAVLYFDPMSVSNISEALRQLIHNPMLRQDLILKGWAQQQQFSWQQAAHQFAAVFDKIIGQV